MNKNQLKKQIFQKELQIKKLHLHQASNDICNQLYNSLYGKGAFRRFKDYCFESNIIQDWYKYKEQKKK